MKKFIVAGVQRSGTTLITTSLNSHPCIHCDGELFKSHRPRGEVDVKDSGYLAYLDTSWLLHIKDRLWRRRLVYAFLDRYFEAEQHGAVGFKLMRNHMDSGRFPMLAKYLVDRRISVIHIIRANVLKVYISRLGARRRRNFHATRAVSEPPLNVPVADLERQLTRIQLQTMELRKMFQCSVPYMAVTYEGYVANPEAEQQPMLDFLAVGPADLRSPLVKLNPDKLSQVVANFDEVRGCLTGTPFEPCLADSTDHEMTPTPE